MRSSTPSAPTAADGTTSAAKRKSVRILPGIALCLLAALLLQFFTILGNPFGNLLSLDDWSWKNILVFFGLSLAMAYLATRFHWQGRWRNFLSEVRGLLAGKGKILLLIIALSAVLAGALTALITVVWGYSEPLPLGSFLFFLVIDIALIVFFHEVLPRRLEYFFAVIALGIGLCICSFGPGFTGYSWDDQIHYANAESISYLFTPNYTAADTVIAQPDHVTKNTVDEGFSLQGISAFRAYLDDLALSDFKDTSPELQNIFGKPIVTFSSLGSIPSAVGLWLARLIHLPFTLQFFTGRLFNLLFYIVMVFLSLRKLRSKRLIVCAIALLPTSLFLAANYSYDAWLLALTIYGFSYFIGMLQDHDRPVTVSDLVKLIVAFVLGLGPKAVLFPLMFILLLMPKRKFTGTVSRRAYNASIIIAALLVVLSFTVPMLTSGAPDDTRTFSDANSPAQISWVLGHFGQYLGMLFSYLVAIIIPPSVMNGYTSLAYLGTSDLFHMPLYFLLLALALLDTGACDRPFSRPLYWIVALLCAGAALALICSALYVSYNPVGSPVFHGVQGRYILPLLLPVLAIGLNFRLVKWDTAPPALSITGISLSLVLLYATYFEVLVSHFVA